MYQAIVFLPLFGFLIVGLFGSSLGAKASEYITSGFLVIFYRNRGSIAVEDVNSLKG